MKSGNNSRYMFAIVVNIDDEKGNPRNEDRIQIRIPSVHGPTDAKYLPPYADPELIIEDEFLPWAQVCYPIGTKDPDKHSFFEEGEIVFVALPQNDIKFPIIIGTLGKVFEE